MIAAFICNCFKNLKVLQQDIALVVDVVFWRYHKTTPKDEKTKEEATHAMRVGAKEKMQS